MNLRPADIRPPRRIRVRRLTQTLKLPAPHVFQIHPVRPRRRRLVEVHRHAKPPPDLQPRLPRQHRTLRQRNPADRHKRHHVRRPDSRMHPTLLRQIDQLRRPAHPAHRRLHHRRRPAPQSSPPSGCEPYPATSPAGAPRPPRMAATICATFAASVPSEKLGTHSITASRIYSAVSACRLTSTRLYPSVN